MKNKLILSLGILFLLSIIFGLNLVSAGLCKGSDGYYHDCNDFSDKYYKDNFYPNYKTEYYKETSESKTSILSIKEDRYNYEKITASSSEQTNIESYKIERDYSYPKTKYDKYGRDYYDTNYNNYYKWDNEPHMVVFLNKGPAYSQEKDNENNKNSDSSDWRNEGEYNAAGYSSQYDNYYYKPRFSENKRDYNWNW